MKFGNLFEMRKRLRNDPAENRKKISPDSVQVYQYSREESNLYP